jgi:type IV secretory pathway component VirB8
MPEELVQKIDEQQKKIDAIYVSVERLRKYFMWTVIITVVTVVLPIIALAFILPWFIKTMTSAYGI